MSDRIRGSVNNGMRVRVDLPDFAGLASFVERGALAYLSYRTNARKPPALGSAITIDGEEWAVVEEAMSPRNKGFRIVALRKGV